MAFGDDLLKLSCAMICGMFAEDAFAGAPPHFFTLCIRHMLQDTSDFMCIGRKQNFLARCKELLDTCPSVSENGRATCGGFKEAHGW
jgi:hypothetical protein